MATDSGVDLYFHFDYISHNAYLAWLAIHELAEGHRRRVVPIPTLFAGLLNAHGQLGPAEIPAKSRWMAKDVLRKAALLGVPLERPASHPFKALLSLRISSLDMSEGTRRRLIDGCFAQPGRRLPTSAIPQSSRVWRTKPASTESKQSSLWRRSRWE